MLEAAGSQGKPIRVWIVDDDDSVRWVLEKALQAEQMLGAILSLSMLV